MADETLPLPVVAPLPPLESGSDALQIVVDAISRLSAVEVRMGAVERNQLTLSGQLEGVEAQGDQNGMDILQLRGSVTSLLASQTELHVAIAAVGTTLKGIQDAWTPTITEIKPILEERRAENVVHVRDVKRRDAIIGYLGVVATLLSVLVTSLGILATVSKWPQLLTLLGRVPELAVIVAVIALGAGALIWRSVPKRSGP